MPAKEIKELRKAGKTDDAYTMAQAELKEAQSELILPVEKADGAIVTENIPANLIWPKRNLSWVLFDYLKANTSIEHLAVFIKYLKEIVDLELPETETMLYEQLAWQIGKMLFMTQNNPTVHNLGVGFTPLAYIDNIPTLVSLAISLPYPKPSAAYSFLFKALHKVLKRDTGYISMADWWGFENFRKEDFEDQKGADNQELMSIAEQAYITYAKHLAQSADINAIKSFLPRLETIIREHPEYLYPSYYKGKLLLALGQKENSLSALLPFARKNVNDFWVWEILSESVEDEKLVLSCYCKALLCKTQDEFLVNIRQKLASILIKSQLYAEAKREILLLANTRLTKHYKIPEEAIGWAQADWFKITEPTENNVDFYKEHQSLSEALLFSDYPEEAIIVEFVNRDKKILNFVSPTGWLGFFKYDRFDINVNIGDILKVRFKDKQAEGLQHIHTLYKEPSKDALKDYFKSVSGKIEIGIGKNYGLIDDVYVPPAIIKSHTLSNGVEVRGEAMKTYNIEKEQWGWKLFRLE